MTNKTDITNSITTIDTGGLNTAEEVRNVFTSVLDGVYSDSVTDTNVLQTYTTSNATCTYNAEFFKNGNTITLNATVTINANVTNGIIPIFGISSDDLKGNGTGFGTKDNGKVVRVNVIDVLTNGNYGLYLIGTVLAGETYLISITYNSLN